METNKKYGERLLLGAILAAMVLLAIGFDRHEYEYQRYDTGTLEYVRAEVLEIWEEELTPSGADGEYVKGYQKIMVRILEGQEKGELLELENYITVQSQVIAEEGSCVIVCVDKPENAEPYYTLYNYDRSSGVVGIAAIFLAIVLLVGKGQGLKSILALVFTLEMVICYLIPSLYEGHSAVWATMVTVALSCAVTCFCIGGITKKTGLNLVSAVLGGAAAGVMYQIFAAILHISGCSMEDAEALVLISQSTGLKLEGVLFAGITVASLGAAMDVAVSLGASLSEISSLNPDMSRMQLFRSGMNIGKDMIGTMTNTLILAFAGGALSTILALISCGVQFHQMLSSNYLAMELAKGLAGSAAVVLTVPISAAVCAVGYGNHKKQQGGT